MREAGRPSGPSRAGILSEAQRTGDSAESSSRRLQSRDPLATPERLEPKRAPIGFVARGQRDKEERRPGGALSAESTADVKPAAVTQASSIRILSSSRSPEETPSPTSLHLPHHDAPPIAVPAAAVLRHPCMLRGYKEPYRRSHVSTNPRLMVD